MIDQGELADFIEECIQEYHDKILARLLKLKLREVLKRKNPYLFRVKALNTSQDLVESILGAHLSSQEEGIFGGLLEKLAIYVCEKEFGGIKSSAEGIDLEFERSDVRYIVSIKSGPHWGNSASIAKLKDHFKRAKRIIGTNTTKQNVVAVNGCCYGMDESPDKGEYLKLCGQRFWDLISGNKELYIEIIKPLGHQANERNSLFCDEYSKVINKFTLEFSLEYCDKNGAIDWSKLLKYNSGKKE